MRARQTRRTDLGRKYQMTTVKSITSQFLVFISYTNPSVGISRHSLDEAESAYVKKTVSYCGTVAFKFIYSAKKPTLILIRRIPKEDFRSDQSARSSSVTLSLDKVFIFFGRRFVHDN